MNDGNTLLDDRPLLSPRRTARLLQTAFLLVFALSTTVLLLVDPDAALRPSFLMGSLLVVGATALAYTTAFDAPHYRLWMLTMPALDHLAIFAIRAEGTGGVTNPLVLMLAMPAAWVGLTASRAALALLTPMVLSVIIPDIVFVLDPATDVAAADRSIMLVAVYPIVMMLAAGIAYLLASVLAERQQQLIAEQASRSTAARESERSRRLLDAVLDTLDVGVIVITPTGERVLMNRLLRDSPALTVRGQDPWEAFASIRAFSADRVTPIAPEDSALARVMRGETVTDRLAWVGAPGKKQVALSVSASPVHTETGGHLANVVLITDVTEYLQALEAKDAFIGTVSHELRTPLTTLAGFLELIAESDEAFSEETRQWLDVMERNVQRQQMLVRDLLTAAGSRNAPIALQTDDADLLHVARESTAAIAPEAATRNIRLTVDGDPALGEFDALRMTQVAENLITNAVRYTPEGGQVHVHASARADELVMVVRDTGIGIAPDDQERLFEQFFRAADARASATRGVGLGLPIVKAIVDAHGGGIDVVSEQGTGTTVTVRVPRKRLLEA
ncbi:ATP-binding protein [Microcella daejeonensis]|uniref:sensor histidine kinase n=1 Tax=Microcella daejeonensis TaxID=2994971 RepID=UPI002270151C|nr:ATP-binding protein [Microcella daejeonensis]WAB84736.1 ATP-binding protein [Microcella daejeonensis]